MKVQIRIFQYTDIMGQDLVHPYIQSTIKLCDTQFSMCERPQTHACVHVCVVCTCVCGYMCIVLVCETLTDIMTLHIHTLHDIHSGDPRILAIGVLMRAKHAI